MAHPLHPALVHAPIACWVLIPCCDVAANLTAPDFYHQVAALLAGLGVAGGALAATAGALDFERGHNAAPQLAIAHASLMGGAFTLSLLSAIGRVDAHLQVLALPPVWAVAASALALAALVVGGWCGGQMVYGHGVGVSDPRR